MTSSPSPSSSGTPETLAGVPGPAAGSPLLAVRDLAVTFGTRGSRPVHAVDQVSFEIRPGQHVGLVGESGSGKSVTSLAIMGLLPRRGVQTSGEVLWGGQNLLEADRKTMSRLRGRDIAMVFQDPMTSLNPVVPVGVQVSEVIVRHEDVDRREATDRAEALLRKVGIPDPGRRLGEYPHQLSGGMRQRVLIAMALACGPTLLMITHDLGVVAGLCDEVNVMYSGRIVESTNRDRLFADPRHPYTGGLLESIPRLDSPRGTPLRPIPGAPTQTIPWSQGCAFAPRCRNKVDACTGSTPVLEQLGDRQLRCFNPLTEARQEVRA